MNTKLEAMKQAAARLDAAAEFLDAVHCHPHSTWNCRATIDDCRVAAAALREALAEQQEPTCNPDLQVWVIPKGKGRGQFSWEPQDERFWTRMEPAVKQSLTAQPEPAQQAAEPVALDAYDTGLLNDFGGGNVDWWWDYIRAELSRAHDYYQSQIDGITAHPAPTQQPVKIPPLARRRVFDYIREAYDLGYNDARNAKAVPGDGAPGYKGRDVEADHGGALLHALEALGAQTTQQPLTDEQKDAARWRWLSWHIKAGWDEGKFTSLVRIVSDENRLALNASIDRMMAGDWSDTEAAHGITGSKT